MVRNRKVNQKGGAGTIPGYFFDHQTLLKMFHFETKLWSRHKASDAYLGKFGCNFDRFMEVYQGIVGKEQTKTIQADLTMLNDETVFGHLEEFIEWLKLMDLNEVLGNETGLMAIRDEMVADAQQLVYLMRDFQ